MPGRAPACSEPEAFNSRYESMAKNEAGREVAAARVWISRTSEKRGRVAEPIGIQSTTLA